MGTAVHNLFVLKQIMVHFPARMLVCWVFFLRHLISLTSNSPSKLYIPSVFQDLTHISLAIKMKYFSISSCQSNGKSLSQELHSEVQHIQQALLLFPT